MNRFVPQLSAVTKLLILVAPAVIAQGVDGQDILDGLSVSQESVKELKGGGVLFLNSEPYEQSPRELAADAVVLVKQKLEQVVTTFHEHESLVPMDKMLAHEEVFGDDDFAGVAYTKNDYKEVARLIKAKPGKDFNFSESEYELIRHRLGGVRNATQEAQIRSASDLMREILLGRYHAYLQAGLDGIAEYKRSSRKQVLPGQELRFTTETFQPFESHFPNYYHVMTRFPEEDDCCKHEFRWLKVDIRDRPTFVLAHTMFQLTDEFLLVTERFFYATNSLNTIQITLAWLPYDEDTYMGISMSASADILDSMLGRMLRPLGRNKAKDLVEETLVDFTRALRDPADTPTSGSND